MLDIQLCLLLIAFYYFLCGISTAVLSQGFTVGFNIPIGKRIMWFFVTIFLWWALVSDRVDRCIDRLVDTVYCKLRSWKHDETLGAEER